MGRIGAPEGCEGPVRRRSLESFATRPLAGGSGSLGSPRPLLMPLFTEVPRRGFCEVQAANR